MTVKHFTATTYLFNPDFSKTLLLKHPKFKNWIPPGGHMDANETPEEAARREIAEEIGVLDVNFLNNNNNLDFSDSRAEMLLQPHFIMSQIIEKDHFHLDMIFFATIDEKEYNSPEGHDLKWMTLNEVTNEPEMFDNVKKVAIYGFKKLSLIH